MRLKILRVVKKLIPHFSIELAGVRHSFLFERWVEAGEIHHLERNGAWCPTQHICKLYDIRVTSMNPSKGSNAV